ncbi:hypothetical protein KBB27_03340 [Patescibacteria group bacterium]|nr:hypothetical protein [Patescibacteria group bacterium]
MSLIQARHRFATDPTYRRRFIFLVLGFFSVFGWMYIFFSSQLFLVDSVSVTEGQGIDSAEAKTAVLDVLDGRKHWRPWSPRNAWFVDRVKLAEEIKTRWFADSVEVEVQPWSHVVRLIVSARTNSFLVKTPTQYLRVDTQGVVREELNPSDRLLVLQRMAGKLLATATTEPIVELPNVTETVAARYKIPIASSVMRDWLRVDQATRNEGVNYSYMRIETARVVLYSTEQIPMYIDTSQNVPAQIKALHEFISQVKAKKIAPATQFVDARIIGRLYVK